MSKLFDIGEVQRETKSNEWYTPQIYIEAAREVMKGIDLDPASCEFANRVVKAKRYYAKEQDGLKQDWSAESIFLNPPYARTMLMQAYHQSLIGLFMRKLQDTYETGQTKQAIALVTTEVNAQWFIPLWNYPICFPDHRIHFIVPHKRPHGDYKQMFGSCFVYFGPDEQTFTEIFSQFGHIVKSIGYRPRSAQQATLWDLTDSSVLLTDPSQGVIDSTVESLHAEEVEAMS